MSSIIDALKKTQSAINQKPYTDRSIYGDIDFPGENTCNEKPFSPPAKNKKQIGKAFISNFSCQKLLWPTLALLFSGGIWIGYYHDQTIANAFSAFINKTEKIFYTPSKKINVITPLTLNGTIRAGASEDVLINNALYHVNDIVSGYKILEIHDDRVTLIDPVTQKKIILKTTFS